MGPSQHTRPVTQLVIVWELGCRLVNSLLGLYKKKRAMKKKKNLKPDIAIGEPQLVLKASPFSPKMRLFTFSTTTD